MRHHQVAAAIASALLLVASVGTITVSAEPPDAVERAVAFREGFGLPADRNTIQSLLADPQTSDNQWQVPLSADERSQVERQLAFQQEDHDLLSFVRADLKGFAGVFIDHPNGGRYVVLTTRPPTADQRQQAERLAPDGARVVFRDADRTYDQLMEVYDSISDEAQQSEDSSVLGIGLTEKENLVVVSVGLDTPERVVKDLTDRYGNAIRVERHAADEATACNDRFDCHADPWRGGIEMQANGSSNPACTMGFQVYEPSTGDKLVLSAGHCSPNSWAHDLSNPEYIGPTTERNYFNNATADALVINISKWYGHKFYVRSSEPGVEVTGVQAWGDDTLYDFVCKSGYKTQQSCGYIYYMPYESSEDAGHCGDDGWSGCQTLKQQRKVLITLLAPWETYGVDHGDSGAPVYDGGVALGIEDRLSEGHAYFVYSHIQKVLDAISTNYAGLKVCRSTDSYAGC